MKLLVLSILILLVSCSKDPGSTYTKPDKETLVGFLPYKGIDNRYVSDIKGEIEKYYGVKVKVLDATTLPKTAFINIKSPRFRADSLIAYQKRIKPKDVDYIVGLTAQDISITKSENGKIRKPEWKYNDFGIMGLAYCPGNSAVISYFRLGKEKPKRFGRFKKVTIHEMGHNFGLPHCPDKKCVMTDAVESIKTVDNANPWLCDKCKAKVFK